MNNVWNQAIFPRELQIPAGIARNVRGRGDARGRAQSEGGVVLRVAGGLGSPGAWSEREREIESERWAELREGTRCGAPRVYGAG